MFSKNTKFSYLILPVFSISIGEKDFEGKLENFKNELKSSKKKNSNQQKIIEEILAKEKDYEVKVVENMREIEPGKVDDEDICRNKNKTENVVNHGDNIVEDIVVKELIGRNVTILKTNVENNIPKTVDKNLVTKKIEVIVKPKPKRTKITK